MHLIIREDYNAVLNSKPSAGPEFKEATSSTTSIPMMGGRGITSPQIQDKPWDLGKISYEDDIRQETAPNEDAASDAAPYICCTLIILFELNIFASQSMFLIDRPYGTW